MGVPQHRLAVLFIIKSGRNKVLILNMINSLREVAVFFSRRVFFTVNLLSHLTFNQDAGFKERALLKVGGTLMTNITANVLPCLKGDGTGRRREC